MADDIDETTLPQMVNELLPQLQIICQTNKTSDHNNNYNNNDSEDNDLVVIRGHALAVVAGIIAALGLLTGKFQKEVISIITPQLPQWVDIFINTLNQQAESGCVNKADVKAKTEVRGVCNQTMRAEEQ